MFKKLIAKIASSLKRHKIPYMVIGGQAVLLYGTPRLTKDIDITVGLGIEGLPLVIKAVRDAGLKIIPSDYKDFVEKTFVLPVMDKKSGIRADFIFSFTPYERQAIQGAKDVAISGVKTRFASLEDVVIHKVFSGRARDIEDVRSILIKNPDFDMRYIKRWLLEFDRASGEKNYSGTFKEILKDLKRQS